MQGSDNQNSHNLKEISACCFVAAVVGIGVFSTYILYDLDDLSYMELATWVGGLSTSVVSLGYISYLFLKSENISTSDVVFSLSQELSDRFNNRRETFALYSLEATGPLAGGTLRGIFGPRHSNEESENTTDLQEPLLTQSSEENLTHSLSCGAFTV